MKYTLFSTPVMIICMSFLIGYCHAGVDQPPDVAGLTENTTQPITEQETQQQPEHPPPEQTCYPQEKLPCASPIVIGMPGPQGPIGTPGFPGSQGPSGFPGNPGNNGNNGQPGPAGRPGTKGEQGEQGVPGINGPPGGPGFTGPTGDKGDTGLKGDTGSMGLPGKHGIAGTPGPPGASGPAGINGFDGIKGGRGFPGVKGEIGECKACPPPPETDPPRNPNSNGRNSRRKVAFSAARTTSLLATNGPIILTYQKIFTNQGGHFDEETGIFHCYVPGTYYFSVNIYKSSNQNFPLVQLLKNGDHTVGVIDYGITDTEDGASNSVILDLEDSDQVYLQLYDGRELYSSHYRFTTFSGFLIFEA
ncbi:uncharacterized protein [Asterias amurensis]|uniref:uncharacterized protein n=1 Tax=Asterias amurensis TaxID=7602 RepID=UPI003AB5FA13